LNDNVRPFLSADEKSRTLTPSLVRELANAAMGRKDVLPFWFGESDQPTPAFLCETAIESLRAGQTFYTENLGRDYLRAAISRYLSDLHGRSIGVNRIAVTGSGDSALMLTSQLLIQPGDRAVAVTPLWPNALEIPKILGAEVVPVSLEVVGGRWALSLQRLLDALVPGTRMLVLNSPNNPTGWTIDEEHQREILAHCRKHGIWILADDVYERLVEEKIGRSAPSFLSLAEEDDRLIGVNSFSKAWRMTGWRVGWMVVPPQLMSRLSLLIEYNTSCVPEFVQRAATLAVEQGEPYVAQLRAELSEARKNLLSMLRQLPGVEATEPDGAMYMLLRLDGYRDSVALANLLVDRAGLGLAPGLAFGDEAEGWLRWCYAAQPAKIESGIERLERFLSFRPAFV
jgi:aspartate/methionine/tyrosine aminotransferase